MKDSEFIDLLNLYLDHEISEEDSARLEAEVLRDAGRRELYRQYCRMQKACVLLAERAREAAAADEPVPSWAVETRPSWGGGLWAAGALAAAACAAVVFVRWHAPAAPAAAAHRAAGMQVAAQAPAAAAPADAGLQPVFVARSLAGAPNPGEQLLFASGAGGPDGQLAWMTHLQLPPVQAVPIDQLFSQPKPVLQFDSGSGRASGAPAEISAFQYAK